MFLLNCIRHPTPLLPALSLPNSFRGLGTWVGGEQIGLPIRGTPAQIFFRCQHIFFFFFLGGGGDEGWGDFFFFFGGGGGGYGRVGILSIMPLFPALTKFLAGLFLRR